MTRLLKFLSVLLLVPVLLMGIAVQAQDVTLTIDPESGDPGDSFSISVGGLEPGENYTADFVLEASGEVLFTTTRTASPEGSLSLSISTTASDRGGTYQVIIRQDETTVVEGAFTLSGDAAQPAETPAPQEPESDRRVTLRIIPESDEAGGTHDIIVSGLEPEEQVTIQIDNPAGETVYNRPQVGDATGRLTIEIFTTLEEAPGDYTVTLLDDGGTSLAIGLFTVEEPAGRDASVTVTPTTGAAGSTHVIEVVDLEPFADIRVRIVGVVDGDEILSRQVRAGVDGDVQIEFTSEDDATDGVYTVIVEDGAVRVGTGELIVEGDGESATDETPEQSDDTAEPDESEASAGLSITPESGSIGTGFEVEVMGLAADIGFMLEVVVDDEVVYTAERSTDAEGNFSTTLTTSDEDVPGTYMVRILEGDMLLLEGSFELTAADMADDSEQSDPADETGVSLRVSPQGGDTDTLRIITATGLEPGAAFLIEVMQADDILETIEKTADVNGNIAAGVVPGGEEDGGPYTAVIYSADDAEMRLAEAVFYPGAVPEPEVVETPDETEPDETDEQADTAEPAELAISVDPAVGGRGSVHIITVTGLDTGETIELEILLDGESIYTTERTADRQGQAVVRVSSNEDDTPGVYDVIVTRAGEMVLSDTLEVTEDIVQMPEPPDETDEADETPEQTDETPTQAVTLTVDPIEGERGSTHTIVVEGLEAGETVTLDVVYEGDVVYTSEQMADGDGVIRIALGSDPGDAAGEYTVRVLRDGEVLADNRLVVTEPGQTDEPDTVEEPVEIVIDPVAGPPGTTHNVTISGLEAGETVTLDVLYDGMVDYTTERTADADGIITIALAAAESDPAGVYTVTVIRGGETIASADLTVEAVEMVEPDDDMPDAVTGGIETEAEDLLNVSDSLTDDFSLTYSFSGSQGDVVEIELVSPDFDAYLILEDDTGAILTEDDDSAGDLNAAIGPYTLPYDGSYTVVVTGYDALNFDTPINGNFMLSVVRLPLNLIVAGEPVTVSFDEEQSTVLFGFEAAIGEELSVDVSGDVDTRLTLTGPDGIVAVEDDDGGEGLNPEIHTYTVLLPGMYTLELSTYEAGTVGSATITLDQEPARSLSPQIERVTVTPKQPVAALTLPADAGQTVLVDVVQISGTPDSVSVEAIQGDNVLMSYSSLLIPQGTRLGFVVPATGPIAVTVTTSDGTSVTLDIAIAD